MPKESEILKACELCRQEFKQSRPCPKWRECGSIIVLACQIESTKDRERYGK